MSIDVKISSFIAQLSNYKTSGNIENPYYKEECVYNLECYLKHISKYGSHIMLVGEAPGYRGCQLTGIPFTDEVQLKNADNYFALGDWARSQKNGNTRETSATYIWESIRQRKDEGFVPLMWNSFPFHPYLDKLSSNRPPNKQEILFGKGLVQQLAEIFEIKKENIYAIGRKAQYQLEIPSEQYIRHPSHGGKEKCIEGILRIQL